MSRTVSASRRSSSRIKVEISGSTSASGGSCQVGARLSMPGKVVGRGRACTSKGVGPEQTKPVHLLVVAAESAADRPDEADAGPHWAEESADLWLEHELELRGWDERRCEDVDVLVRQKRGPCARAEVELVLQKPEMDLAADQPLDDRRSNIVVRHSGRRGARIFPSGSDEHGDLGVGGRGERIAQVLNRRFGHDPEAMRSKEGILLETAGDLRGRVDAIRPPASHLVGLRKAIAAGRGWRQGELDGEPDTFGQLESVGARELHVSERRGVVSGRGGFGDLAGCERNAQANAPHRGELVASREDERDDAHVERLGSVTVVAPAEHHVEPRGAGLLGRRRACRLLFRGGLLLGSGFLHLAGSPLGSERALGVLGFRLWRGRRRGRGRRWCTLRRRLLRGRLPSQAPYQGQSRCAYEPHLLLHVDLSVLSTGELGTYSERDGNTSFLQKIGELSLPAEPIRMSRDAHGNRRRARVPLWGSACG